MLEGKKMRGEMRQEMKVECVEIKGDVYEKE